MAALAEDNKNYRQLLIKKNLSSTKMSLHFHNFLWIPNLHIYFFFQNINHNCKLRSKRGLLPFVELNGEEIADSDIIIKQLSAKFEKDNPSANLADEQKNIQHAMVTMVENHLQW